MIRTEQGPAPTGGAVSQQQGAPGLDQAAVAKAVANAAEPVLKRVLKALGSQNREEAVALVTADPEAARVAAGVLGQAAETTQEDTAPAPAPTAGEASAPIADREGGGAPDGAPATTSEQQAGGLAQQVMAAPEGVWDQLKRALGVQTREEAAQLVESDQEAATKAMQILGAAAQRGVPRQGQPETPARPERSMAERVYPKGKRKSGGGAKITF